MNYKVQNRVKFYGGILAIALVCMGLIYFTPLKYHVLESFSNNKKQIINVKADFGAKGDGSTNDTKAFQNAMAYAETAKKTLYIPAGSYVITDTLSSRPIRIYGEGEGKTRLIFKNLKGKDGISFTVTNIVGDKGEISDLTIIARGSHGGSAIKTPEDASLYLKYHVRYSFHDLEFRGDEEQSVVNGFVYDYGWKYYLDIADSWGTYIEKIDAIGTYRIDKDPAKQPDQTFIRLNAKGNIMTARINRITTHGIKRGIEVGNRCFFFIDQSDIAHAYEGIIDTGTTTYSEGRITNTLINAQYRGIYLADRSWVAITNVAINRHKNGFNSGDDWYGMYLNNVGKSWIEHIRTQVDVSVTEFTGNKYGIYFKDSLGITATGLKPGVGIDYAIVNDNTFGATFDGTDFQGDRGTAWIFKNNSQNIKIGTFITSRAIDKTYSIDKSIDKTKISIVSTTNLP